MTDLSDFLLARIADDEELAQLAVEQGWTWRTGTGLPVAYPEPFARRVLAECDAKRRIVELDEYAYDDGTFRYVLRLLALPYADHPDYRQEWKP